MDSKHRQIIVVDDPAALAETAAQRLLSRIAHDGRCSVCLTGGSSPEGLYRLLAEEPWRGAGGQGLATYRAGSEGPAEAERLLAQDGRRWRAIA